MKRILLATTLVVFSAFTQADVAIDMANPNLTMDQVVQFALASGDYESAADVLDAIYAVNPDQTGIAIVALVSQAPSEAGDVVAAAINLGRDPVQVVQLAVGATSDPDVADDIVAKAIASTEGLQGMIVSAAVASTNDPAIRARVNARRPQGQNTPANFGTPDNLPSDENSGGVTQSARLALNLVQARQALAEARTNGTVTQELIDAVEDAEAAIKEAVGSVS